MHIAFKTWDHPEESLESVELRIHDGLPREALHGRADGYVSTMYGFFPHAAPKDADIIMEIGSGVGYIMEAVMRRFAPAQIIGLDVAPAMIEHAKRRLLRDGVSTERMVFQAYDGLTIPLADFSVDHVYSVACLQHVPKIYVYHLFSEVLRILRRGYAVVHLLSFSHMASQYSPPAPPFISEIRQQLHGIEGHWHHFYSKDEVVQVLLALGAIDVEVTETGGGLWAAFSKFPKPNLPIL